MRLNINALLASLESTDAEVNASTLPPLEEVPPIESTNRVDTPTEEKVVTNAAGVRGSMVPADEHGELPPVFVPLVEQPAQVPADAVVEEAVVAEEPVAEPEPLAHDDLENVQYQADAVADATTALEQFAVLLEQAGAKGVSKQAAAFMHVGYAQAKQVIHGSKTTGLESFDSTPRSAIQYTTVALEDVKETLSAGKAKLKELLEKLWKFIEESISKGKEVLANLFTGLTGLENTMDRLKGKLAEVKVSPDAPSEITIKPSAWLCIEGKVTPFAIGSITKLVDFGARTWPKAVLDYLTELNKHIASVKAGAEVDMDNLKVEMDAVYGIIVKMIKANFAGNYLGNLTLDVSDTSGYSLKGTEKAEVPESYTVGLRSVGDMAKHLNMLYQELDKLKHVTANNEKVINEIKTIRKTLDAKTTEFGESAINNVMKIINRSPLKNYGVMFHVGRMISAQVKFIEAELAALSAPPAKKLVPAS